MTKTHLALRRQMLAIAALLSLAGPASSAVQYQVTVIDTLPGFTLATPNDINNHGVVVGVAQGRGGTQRAFSWQDGVLTDLGALAGGNGRSVVRSINDNGLIVGTSNARRATSRCNGWPARTARWRWPAR
jgi:probable HAF family extracellular repeat protein